MTENKASVTPYNGELLSQSMRDGFKVFTQNWKRRTDAMLAKESIFHRPYNKALAEVGILYPR